MHSSLRVLGEMGCRIVWIFLLVVGVVCGDYRNDDGGFMPSPSYRTEDQLAEPSARVEKSREDRERAERDNQPERTQRFGISTYGPSGGQGPYGGTSPGIYGPVKIDLGGVLIGSILGFGAVLILPKIMHALSYGYGGGYGRSTEPDFHQVTDMLNKLDETLARYNIDSAACMQRLACQYVQLANENTITGNATDFDALLTNLSSNSLIRRMLDGTSIYEAMSAGQSLDNNCQTLYPKCKLDKKTVVKMLTQLVPST
ncbi:DM4/DM12 family domain-containing protein [Phthorimaea operculella]|nr:DM4/DM12 family domain-containing protein [Phthorimaea operculella]